MDLFDDYKDEVEKLTDAQIDALFSGEDHSGGAVATLIRDVRLGLLESPSPEISARHLAAMAATRPPEPDRVAARSRRLGRTRSLPRTRLTAVAVAAAILLLAGLAAAMTLPKELDQSAPDTVVTTPPSAGPAGADLVEEATHGQTVSDVARDRSLTACEKGQAVAAVASDEAAEHRNNPDQQNDPCTRAQTKSKSRSRGNGDNPAAAGGITGARNEPRSVGAGTTNAPGLSREPGNKGFEASGGAGEKGHESSGGVGQVGLGGRGGLGGTRKDAPTP
jgi:hypothetical protein